MRMKAEFYCISFLLLIGYAYSSDRRERGTLLGKLSYGKILPRSAFTTRFQVNVYQCATECWLRKQRCKSFNYRRIYPSCQLCEEDSMDGSNLHSEHDSIHSNIVTWKNINMGNCSALNCTWTERCDPFNATGSACVPSVSCDIDYNSVSFGGYSLFIKFHDTKTIFNEAVKICQSENAKLLVVTAMEHTAVRKEAFSQKHGWVFPGISNQAQENTWLVWDGTNRTKSDWNPRKPNEERTGKCEVIDFDQDVSGVKDVSCNEKCSFLCQKS